MTRNVKSIGESLSNPDDPPKLTREWAEGADAYRGNALVRRGRPRLETTKQHVSLRLDPDVLESFKSAGPGWQSRINDVLRKAARL